MANQRINNGMKTARNDPTGVCSWCHQMDDLANLTKHRGKFYHTKPQVKNVESCLKESLK